MNKIYTMHLLTIVLTSFSSQNNSQSPSNPIVLRELHWLASPTAPLPKARVCPLLYDKKWAYSVEIDDGPVSTLTVTQPLLANYAFTDAPPGVSGGRKMPFVGGAAVIAKSTGGNSSYLSWEQLRQLEALGWETLNHGYWHSGNSWDPKAAMIEEQLRTELFWSQAVMEAETANHRRPTHLVYPNGYMAYKPYLREYGMHSASRVAGKKQNLFTGPGDHLDIDRNFLDESVWSKPGNSFEGLPTNPAPGEFIIDFTHGMEAYPQSANHRRWVERFDSIAAKWGKKGDDSIWCAPTSAVIRYREAALRADVRVGRGALQVAIPAEYADSPITIQLMGIEKDFKLISPDGVLVYRKGDMAWVTFPAPLRPKNHPTLQRIYSGPAESVTFPTVVKLAAVRVLQVGGAAVPLKIDLEGPSEEKFKLADDMLAPAWGAWQLYTLLPKRPAMLVKRVVIGANPALQKMEIWAEVDGRR